MTDPSADTGPWTRFDYRAPGYSVAETSAGRYTHYFFDRKLSTTDRVYFESDFDEADSSAEVYWDWQAAAGVAGGADGDGLLDRYRYRRGTDAWSSWATSEDSSFTIAGARLGEAVDVEVQLQDPQGGASRIVSASMKIAAGAQCADTTPSEGNIQPEQHPGAADRATDVFTFAQPQTQQSIIQKLPPGAKMASFVEYTVPSGGGTPVTSGRALSAGETLQAAFADFNQFMLEDMADDEVQVIADRNAATSASERAELDQEIAAIQERRTSYQTAGGVPIRSIALERDPAIAAQAAANFSSVVDRQYRANPADDDCGRFARRPSEQTRSGRGRRSTGRAPSGRRAPAKSRSTGPRATISGAKVDNTERRVRQSPPPFSGSYSPPSIRVRGTRPCDGCRKITASWRWPKNRYKRYWYQQPRRKESRRGYEIEVLMDQDLTSGQGGSWGFPGSGSASIYSTKMPCPYPEDYYKDNLAGPYSLTVGSSCRPRTRSRWLRWSHGLQPGGSPSSDRVLAAISPVHYAQEDLKPAGGAAGALGLDEEDYCQFRSRATGSCFFSDRVPRYVYCESYSGEDSLIVPGSLTFKRNVSKPCQVK